MNMWPNNVKDWVDVIKGVVTCLGTVVVIYLWHWEGQGRPHLNLKQGSEVIHLDDAHNLVALDITLNNTGIIPVHIEDKKSFINILGITPLSNSKELAGKLAHGELLHDSSGAVNWPPVLKHIELEEFYLEPGEEIVLHVEFTLDSKIQIIRTDVNIPTPKKYVWKLKSVVHINKKDQLLSGVGSPPEAKFFEGQNKGSESRFKTLTPLESSKDNSKGVITLSSLSGRRVTPSLPININTNQVNPDKPMDPPALLSGGREPWNAMQVRLTSFTPGHSTSALQNTSGLGAAMGPPALLLSPPTEMQNAQEMIVLPPSPIIDQVNPDKPVDPAVQLLGLPKAVQTPQGTIRLPSGSSVNQVNPDKPMDPPTN